MNKTSTHMIKKPINKPRGCTEFQLYKNVLLPEGFTKSLVHDFTEFKLKKMIRLTLDGDRKKALAELLAEYQSGKVAVAWNGTNPVYVNISKDV